MNASGGQNSAILRTESIRKTFGKVMALDNVSFSCQKGEVHGLVGENGAGKSTLMKILAGEFLPDQGDVYFRGNRVEFRNPRQSREAGISLVHQEFALVPYLNIAENLFLGKEPTTRLGFIDSKALHQRAEKALAELGIQIPLDTAVVDLSIAHRQLLEIAKSLQDNPQILIMDEPTAALEAHEIDRLFSLIQQIRSQGKTVIFISHRLEEVAEITDRITVLRNGHAVLTIGTSRTTKNELIEAIIGRKLETFFPPRSQKIGKELLRFETLRNEGRTRDEKLTLSEGEILGIAGLEGQGQHALLKTLFGAGLSTGQEETEMRFKGETINLSHPSHAVNLGLGYVPADRAAEGLILSLPIRLNLVLPGLRKRARFGFINWDQEERTVERTIDALSIKVPSSRSLVKYLSGGNQQKVVLGKWLAADADVFIFDEPTRGVDVGTRAEIYSILRKLANEGKAIIMSSRDLDEVIGLSDRVAIIHRGRIIDEFQSSKVSKQQILDIITRAPEQEEEPEVAPPMPK